MSMELLTLSIKGTSTLMMHSDKLANPLHPSTKAHKELTAKRKKTEDDHLAIARSDVHIEYGHSTVLGRQCLGAWVFNPTPGPDVIPRLHDARVTGMAQGGMNVTGIEEVDGVLYAQSWWCRAQ